MKNIVIIDSSIPQYKGNIHMHTTRSDGDYPPQTAAEKYRENGYDFIMISDHEIYWNSDELDKPGFLVLGGTEISVQMNEERSWIIDYERKALGNTRSRHTHMHYCCVKDDSMPDEGQFFVQDQKIERIVDRGIDSWNTQVEFMRRHGNIVFVNHPHWSRLAPELLLASQGISGFEVWNSGNVYKCGGRADEDIWDWCLMRGRKLNAVAADDSHESTTDFGAGFIIVQSSEFTKAGICRALKQGDYYASCGPKVYDMRIEDDVLHMRFSPVKHVKISGYDRDGYNFCPGGGNLFDSLEWPVNDVMRYFRPVLIDAEGNEAWLQPVFVEDML